MEYDYANFPDDLWELIFDRLTEDGIDFSGLEALSLHLKSLQTRLINFNRDTVPSSSPSSKISEHKAIRMNKSTDLNELISQSGINLEALTNAFVLWSFSAGRI
ncbi:hypothetical protein Acr_00g0036390 [Actinidia rufa]|uniref:Uncharacterized protein n=1 Tax=Actinidia rufa TaxID=165716 RepID=A0A7J0DGJ0_9ERIC|nr:hypothetical protein Acr_00g0036390 [Actinidia rufa]